MAPASLAITVIVLGAVWLGAFLPASPAVATGVKTNPAPTPTVGDLVVGPTAVAPAAPAGAVTIYPSQDVYIASGMPNNNLNGSNHTLVGWYAAEQAVRTMIQFNLGQLPSGSRISSATLYLYVDMALPPNDGSMRLAGAPITGGWSEGSVTWNSGAGLYNSQFTLGDVGAGTGWYAFDLTSLVQSWLNGQSNNGLMIIGDETPSLSRSRMFRSREFANYSPSLVVNTNCDTLAPISGMSPLPQYSPGSFMASWSGYDIAPSGCTPSGIRKFHVNYQINNQGWTEWKSTTSTSHDFDNYASNGDTVYFLEYADDNAGNVEATPPGPQTRTIIDSQPPVVNMTPLPAITAATSFLVSWSGTDSVSGIRNYSVQYQINGGNWQYLIENTTSTSYQVTGAQNGQVWNFRAIATDNVGNTSAWPEVPQASTTINLFPQAYIVPFEPNVLKPTAPVTNSFVVAWYGTTAVGTIVEYSIYYRYTTSSGAVGAWIVWDTFPGSQTSESFPWQTMGMKDGLYEFEATATNSEGETTPFTGTPEGGMIVDMANKIHPRNYMGQVDNAAQPALLQVKKE
ncbi:MAG: fibronectin type III domain-containing protein [Anaerolineales bacterium]|nr:fibronectin type III domain-containing protein [Anaerolineales bacterium]